MESRQTTRIVVQPYAASAATHAHPRHTGRPHGTSWTLLCILLSLLLLSASLPSRAQEGEDFSSTGLSDSGTGASDGGEAPMATGDEASSGPFDDGDGGGGESGSGSSATL